MRRTIPLALLLALPAHAKKPDTPTVPTVPSIEEVVAAEGFTPTPSQSEIYKPGAVLVPNGRGGHDVVVSSCIDAEPDIAIMSQSSIATTLAGGVSARLGVARGAASVGVEKRLNFVDPEQRTIALGALVPSADCLSSVERAGKLQDLSQAIVMHDVLVAIIKNTVCTKADASGGVVALGSAEASAFSECVQESDGQVPLGYKAVPLESVLALAPAPEPEAPPAAAPAAVDARPAVADATVELGGDDSDLGALAAAAAKAEAQRKAAEQRAAELAAAAEKARRAQLDSAADGVRVRAAEDYASIASLVDAPTKEGIPALQAFLERYAGATVSVEGVTEAVEVAEVQQVRIALAKIEAVLSVQAGASPAAAAAPSAGGDLAAQLAAAKAASAERELKEQDAAAAAAAAETAKQAAAEAAAADKEARFEAALDALRQEAMKEYAQLEPYLNDPAPEVQAIVKAWATKYMAATVTVDGEERRLQLPEASAILLDFVDLGRFQLMRTEVTVAQYRACVDAGVCSEPGTDRACNWGKSGRDNHPINCVDWNGASAFAEWAGGRLPTGEEWMYAATSGGQPWEYPWGDETATCERVVMRECLNRDQRVQFGTLPVCSKPAGNSTQGVCDLSGNVREWTDEREGASDRVSRGGGWVDNASRQRASYCDGDAPSYRDFVLGFRLAR